MKQVSLDFSDEDLLQALKQQPVSNLAIQFLYRKYYATLSNYIKVNQGSGQDAEDIFQEVIVSFIEAVQCGKFRGDSAIGTFLFSLNRFTWLNELKKRNRKLTREENYTRDSYEEVAGASELIADREAKNMVMQLFDKLGETCKKILLSYYYDNMAMKEILPLMNFENEQVLRNKKYKCLKTLEQMLSADAGMAGRFKNALMYGQ